LAIKFTKVVVSRCVIFFEKLTDCTCTRTSRGTAVDRYMCVVLGWVVLWELTIVLLVRAHPSIGRYHGRVSPQSSGPTFEYKGRKKSDPHGKHETKLPACHFRLRNILPKKDADKLNNIGVFPEKRGKESSNCSC